VPQLPNPEWTWEGAAHHAQLSAEQHPLLVDFFKVLEDTPGFGSRSLPFDDYTEMDQANDISRLCAMFDSNDHCTLSEEYRPIDM